MLVIWILVAIVVPHEATRGLVIKSQANATKFTFLDSGDFQIGTTTVIESNRNLSNVVTATVNTLHIRGENNTGYSSPSSMLGGLSLWGAGATTSQMMFKPIGSGSLGNHGFCTDYYNTYFVMDTTNRGWVFRNATTATNVASISNTGGIAGVTVRASNAFQIGTNTVIDASRNLTNINAITSTGVAGLTRGNGSVGAPNTANHDTGTRIELYNSSATSWYAIGIESNTMWFNSDNYYKFYVDAVSKVDFSNTGVVNAVGGYKVNGTTVIDTSRIFYAQTRVEIQGSGGWAYTRLRNVGSVMWDIAANPADNSSALQFRPFGSGTNATLMSTSGNWTINGTISSGAISIDNGSQRVKYGVWSGTTYGVGMGTGYTYGAINNDYVMSFQMNDDSDRGFWWGDTGHGNDQGAMALSTDGYLTVASGLRLGFGESDTTHPSAGLQVNGTITSTGDISANSGKVRMGNPTLLSGRSSIRIDSDGDSFADLVFGDNVTSTSWTNANWAISSRSSSESNSLKIYRGSGQPSPYNSEHVLMEFKQNNVVSVNSTLQINNTTVIDASRNLTNIGTIASTSFNATNNGTNRFNVNVGGTTETWAANSRATLHLDGTSSSLLGFRHSGSDKGYIFSTGSTLEILSYGEIHLLSSASASYFGKLSAGVWNTSHGYQVNGTTVIDASRNLTNINQITSQGLTRTNNRINSSQDYPVGHYTPSDTVFEIDPTWSEAELSSFFGGGNVTWNADSTAPAGYAIYINGGVNVGGVYGSGFPYIPVGTNDIFYMECYVKNAGSGQTHYMGSNEFNQSFSSLGGNPGSYGYWVMSNTNVGSSWTKVSAYITGFGNSVGQFETGTKYWTPMALFNYGAGSGTRACYISGWKVIKVNASGNRTFEGLITASGNITTPKVSLTNSAYGIGVVNPNSGRFDTVDSGQNGDPLELAYYSGTGVIIGSGGGTKFLAAGSYQIGTTTVIDANRNITGAEVAASTRLYLNGGNYEGQIVFGAVDAWRVGIRQHDDGDAEMRIWAKNANGRVHIATGYDGQPASISRPTDGFVVDHNNVGIGNFSAVDPSEKLHVLGNILMSGGTMRTNHSKGHQIGSYNNIGGNSAKTNPIYTIGSAYNPSDTSLSDMYGIGYAHENLWGSGKSTGWGLYVAASGIFNATISTSGIWSVGNITAYSDRRVKTNIEVIPNALEKVCKLNGYTFDRTDNGTDIEGNPVIRPRMTGVIAQEVLEVLPEAVTGTEEDHYAVAYGNMVGLLIESIKELKSEVDDLKNQLSQKEK